MKYVYITLTVLAALLLIALLVCLFLRCRKKRACRRVRSTACAVKIRELNDALAPFGFVYVTSEDLISSGMYPWQREMGYCRQYDEAALSMNMYFESEPVYFEYDGKRWLIELWKGQYGCTTGAEIGVYVNRNTAAGVGPESLYYECAGDEERLFMSFTLYKNGRAVMSRRGMHWWLTGFLAGEYSRPEELVMEASVCFPDVTMRNAFCEGLLRAGYRREEIRLEQCAVRIRFDRPRTCQPQYRRRRLRRICRRNRRNVRLYCRVTRLFACTLDKICFIAYCFPCLYRKLVRLGMKCNTRKLNRFRRRPLYG